MQSSRFMAILLGAFVASACGGDLVPIRKSTSLPELDCSAHATCGIDPKTLQSIPCGFGTECFALSVCEGARCYEMSQACGWECGTENCAVLESFPAQIACQSP